MAEDASVLVEAGKELSRTAARAARDRVRGSQDASALLEVLDAQELAAERAPV
jgi:hypothetical protein